MNKNIATCPGHEVRLPCLNHNSLTLAVYPWASDSPMCVFSIIKYENNDTYLMTHLRGLEALMHVKLIPGIY